MGLLEFKLMRWWTSMQLPLVALVLFAVSVDGNPSSFVGDWRVTYHEAPLGDTAAQAEQHRGKLRVWPHRSHLVAEFTPSASTAEEIIFKIASPGTSGQLHFRVPENTAAAPKADEAAEDASAEEAHNAAFDNDGDGWSAPIAFDVKRAGEVMTAQGPLHGGGDLYQLSLVSGEHFVMTLLLKSGGMFASYKVMTITGERDGDSGSGRSSSSTSSSSWMMQWAPVMAMLLFAVSRIIQSKNPVGGTTAQQSIKTD